MTRKRIKTNDIKTDKENIQWHTYVYPVLLTQSNKHAHNTLGMKPSDALKDDHR